MHYMQQKNFNPSVVLHRIDVVGIEGKGQKQQNITWLKKCLTTATKNSH